MLPPDGWRAEAELYNPAAYLIEDGRRDGRKVANSR